MLSSILGIHCWVCDKESKALTNEMRGCLIEYLTVYIPNKEQGGNLQLYYPLHPALQRAYKILKPVFNDMLMDQDLLNYEEHKNRILSFVKNPEVRKDIESEWKNDSGSVEKWKTLQRNVLADFKTKKKQVINWFFVIDLATNS